MTCRLTMSLISEAQEGDCGNDWKYDLDVKVYHDGLKGEASVSVPKHTLESGDVRPPFGSPEPVVLFEGDCDDELQVKLLLVATEVDMFVNDVGKTSKDINIECPGPGGHMITREVDIEVPVREAPAIFKKHAVFTLRVRFQFTTEHA